MKTNLPLKKSKPSYDFSRLANSFSNPDLVENVNPSKATKSNNNIPLTDNSILSDYQGSGSRLSSSSFYTPYAKTVSIVPSVREKDWVSFDNIDSKEEKIFPVKKKIHRGGNALIGSIVSNAHSQLIVECVPTAVTRI